LALGCYQAPWLQGSQDEEVAGMLSSKAVIGLGSYFDLDE
jgi:hypothetical protein